MNEGYAKHAFLPQLGPSLYNLVNNPHPTNIDSKGTNDQ
jgi:hypothetical protein